MSFSSGSPEKFTSKFIKFIERDSLRSLKRFSWKKCPRRRKINLQAWIMWIFNLQNQYYCIARFGIVQHHFIRKFFFVRCAKKKDEKWDFFAVRNQELKRRKKVIWISVLRYSSDDFVWVFCARNVSLKWTRRRWKNLICRNIKLSS